jgi:sugar lactone lactonase YvrE
VAQTKAKKRPMTRAQKRKIAIIVILLILLALLAAYYTYYRSTQQLGFDIAPVTADLVDPPQYLYSFNGGEAERMQRPIGVLVDGQDVYVVDSARHKIDVFNPDGDFKRSFGASDTVVPLYIAKNPKDGNLYITDRRARTIHIFKTDGKYVGEFDPELPEDQLPTFDTGGVQWAPVALAFGEDGTFYVTEILNGHRLLVFDPEGKFQRSVGTVGIVAQSAEGPEIFQFPNGIAVHEDSVYVTDSNNRRVQVFDANGNYERLIVTQGLPRGISFLAPFPSDEATATGRFVVVDTLAHDGTLWTSTGTKIVSFGTQGVLEGEFSYPNGVSVGARNKMYITDTANGRVQVWGWPEQVSPVPIPKLPQRWWLCLLPLLLLPLLLALRKKKFFATADFVLTMVDAEEAHLMPAKRRKWLVTYADYEQLKEIKQGDVDMAELLFETEYSETDVAALIEKLEITEQQAIYLSLAQRAKVFATEDAAMRRLAKTNEVDVVNRVEFIERFTKRVEVKNAED